MAAQRDQRTVLGMGAAGRRFKSSRPDHNQIVARAPVSPALTFPGSRGSRAQRVHVYPVRRGATESGHIDCASRLRACSLRRNGRSLPAPDIDWGDPGADRVRGRAQQSFVVISVALPAHSHGGDGVHGIAVPSPLLCETEVT